MSEENKNPLARTEPPKSDDEWSHIFKGVDKAHKSWVVTGPIWHVVTSWRGILAVIAIVSFIRGPEIIDVIKAYLMNGAGQ